MNALAKMNVPILENVPVTFNIPAAAKVLAVLNVQGQFSLTEPEFAVSGQTIVQPWENGRISRKIFKRR